MDAFALNVVWLRDRVAKIDTNSIIDPGKVGQRLVALNHALPDDNAASRGVSGVVENRNKSIGRGFDQPSAMLQNTRLYQSALDPLNSTALHLVVSPRWAAMA